MHTEKLYYVNPNLQQFTAQVTGCTPTEDGYHITLNRTAFYPEGGGQACDTGTLGDARVTDVRERQEQVYHLCDRPLPVGSEVTGIIDWERRFDLMQQHTGEHIISGIIHRMFGYGNCGFHVGEQVMEVDFDGPVSADALAQIEQEANEAVWKDIPVKCWYPDEETLPNVFYRTKRPLPWPVRIVQIPDYDSCACCGVHVTTTGQVGLIKILSCVKFHQGVRLELVCGKRAYRIMRDVFDQNKQVSQTFSAKILETGDAARKASQQLSGEKFRAATLEKRVFSYIADSYQNSQNVVHFEPGLSSGSVRELADKIAQNCAGWAAVYTGSDETGYGLCIVSKTGDVKVLGTKAAQSLDGRGGGKPGSFQGSFRATGAQIEAFFQEYL